MDLRAVRAIANLGNRFFLSILHCLIQPVQFRRHPPANDRARHIGEVAAGCRPWKNVKNDTAMSRQRPASLIVWVTSLFASGHDGVLSDAVTFHQCDIDQFFDTFRGQDFSIQPKLIVTNVRPAQRRVRDGHRRLGGPLGRFDMPDLLGSFDHATLIKWLTSRLKLVAELLQPCSMEKREICRDQDLLDPPLAQQHMDHIHHARFRDSLLFRPSFELRIREHRIDGGLALGPIHFKIAHHQESFSVDLEVDERIGRHEAGCVVEIGIGFAGRNEKSGGIGVVGRH